MFSIMADEHLAICVCCVKECFLAMPELREFIAEYLTATIE